VFVFHGLYRCDNTTCSRQTLLPVLGNHECPHCGRGTFRLLHPSAVLEADEFFTDPNYESDEPHSYKPKWDESAILREFEDGLKAIEARLQAEVIMDEWEAGMKKETTVIEYRFDKSEGWTEYARTQVPSMVEHYRENAHKENPGAEVRVVPKK
jgi:hypothetical protein